MCATLYRAVLEELWCVINDTQMQIVLSTNKATDKNWTKQHMVFRPQNTSIVLTVSACLVGVKFNIQVYITIIAGRYLSHVRRGCGIA